MAGSLDPRGPVAAEIAGLWWLMLWLGLAAFVVFAAVLLLLLVRAWLREVDRAPAVSRPG